MEGSCVMKRVELPHRSRQGTGECRILIAGDLCPQGRPESVLRGTSPGSLWGGIVDLTATYDLCVVNLECPLTEQGEPLLKDGPHLRAHPECAAGIRAGGFHVASLANNHILDMGGTGLRSTLDALARAGVHTVGAGASLTQATEPLFITIGPHRIALLAFAENEFASAGTDRPGAWPLDDIDNCAQIQDARKDGNTVIVLFHGGTEGFDLPSPEMTKRCRHYIRSGAHAVICHHSHVSSGYEQYAGGWISYGTGNFLFDWPEQLPASWYEGYMVGLSIGTDGVTRASIIPHRQTGTGWTVDLTPEADAQRFIAAIDERSRIIASPEELAGAYKAFCAEHRMEYLGRLLGTNTIDEILWERGILKPAWIRRRLATRMLNLFRCESHRELLLEVLRSEYGGMENRMGR